MDAKAIRKAVHRLAHEIMEKHGQLDRLVLAGIPTRGCELASRILAVIQETEAALPELGVVDVSMHRDDLALRGRLTAIEPTKLPLDLEGRPVLLVDDVLYTGRSCRAAMDAVSSYGRPASIEMVALIDRGHRELPICADYIGRQLPTTRDQRIRVRFENLDGVEDSVTLVTP